MKILALVKQTFDTEEKIMLEDGTIQEDGVEFVINPYDEYAVEEAISLRDEHGGDVTVLTFGPSRAESALRTALAMGADQAIHIENEAEMDEYAVTKYIARAIQDEEYDLILGGNMAVDSGAGQVAVRLAEELGIAHISTITRLTVNDRQVTAERDVEGDVEIIEAQLPLLVTAQQGLNEPRYPSLQGIMKAKKKQMRRMDTDELDSPSNIVPRTKVVAQYLPEPKQAGRLLTGDIREQVQELAQLLRTEAKII